VARLRGIERGDTPPPAPVTPPAAAPTGSSNRSDVKH
jgi:hypothetical protein